MLKAYKIVFEFLDNGAIEQRDVYPSEQRLSPEQATVGYEFKELRISSLGFKAEKFNLTVERIDKGADGELDTLIVAKPGKVR